MDKIDLVEDYPAHIAGMLLNDEIDVGLVPVAIIPQLKESYIVTDHCIGADAEVASVAIFSEVPMEQITTVLLVYQSRTSVNLAKVLLKEYWKKEVVFEDAGEDFRSHIKGTAAGVVIGDRALEQRTQSAYIYDLGLAWKKYTGLPLADSRYTRVAQPKPPRKIGRRLWLFDCLTCDKCVPVCPNDANFTFVVPPLEVPLVKLWREGGAWRRRQEGTLTLKERHQIGNFADFCNDCGNCDVFCPEDGGPYVLKPRFFGSEEAWRRDTLGDGFFVEADGQRARVLGRFWGAEFQVHLEAIDPSSGEEILPVFWDDNYFELFPGERREVRVAWPRGAVTATPVVSADAWNAPRRQP